MKSRLYIVNLETGDTDHYALGAIDSAAARNRGTDTLLDLTAAGREAEVRVVNVHGQRLVMVFHWMPKPEPAPKEPNQERCCDNEWNGSHGGPCLKVRS